MQTKPWFRWVLFLLFILAGITYLALTQIYTQAILHRAKVNPFLVATQPQDILTGRAKSAGQLNVKWRTLYHDPIEVIAQMKPDKNYGAFGKLVVANFDQDSDDELLLLRVVESSLLFEMDGSYTEVELCGMGFLGFPRKLDYDQNGVFEIMPDPRSYSVSPEFFPGYAASSNQQTGDQAHLKELPVYNLDGSIAERLPLDKMMCYQASGDFDGDGTLDRLYSNDFPSMDVFAEDAKGVTIWEFTLPIIRRATMVRYLCTGDFDGDGRDEFFNPIEANRIYGMEQKPIDLGDLEYMGFPHCATDINGDGIEEAISQYGLYDFAINEQTMFSFPEGKGSILTDEIFTGDLDNDGKPEIILADPTGTGVYMFDSTGSCIFYEVFDDMMGDFRVAHYQGRDYLVARLMEKILIFP